MFNKIKPPKDEKDNKQSKKESIFSKFDLLLFGSGLTKIIDALDKAGKIKTNNVSKLFDALGVFSKNLSKFSGSILKSVVSFGALSSLISIVIIPIISKLSKINYKEALSSISSFELVLGGLMGLMTTVKVFTASASTTLALISGLIAEIGTVVIEVVGIGTLAVVGISASIAIFATSLGYLADSIKKFNDVNGDNLGSIGIGLVKLSFGLTALLGGVIGGTIGAGIDKISSFFGIDPVSIINKFSKLDADQLLKVGSALSALGTGINSLPTTLNIKNIASDIFNLTKPVIQLSDALDKFAESYTRLDKLKSSTEINVKVRDDNSIQTKLVELNVQEISILSNQLDQLRENGRILNVIATKLDGSLNQTPQVASNTQQNTESNFSGPNFSTKNNYNMFLDRVNMGLNG